MFEQSVFDTLPESVQADYVKNDEGLFVTNDSIKFAGAKKNLDTAYQERDKFKGDLTTYQDSEQTRIKDASDAAYLKAVEDNDTTKLLEIEQQKLSDAISRADASEKNYSDLQQGLATEKEDAIIEALSQHGTERGKSALARLLKGYVKVDPKTGAETYLNDDGSASSLDRKGFITEQLKGNPVFQSLVSAESATDSEGLADGSSRSAAELGKKASREEFEALSPKERVDFLKGGGKIA